MHSQSPRALASDDQAQSATVALFVSDVHLSAALPRTTAAFLQFLHQPARQAKQLYLLGDLFEYWAGDDDIGDAYNRIIVEALHAVRDSGVEIFWMAGNRDFLVGERFAAAAGATLLDDPHVTTIAGHRLVLLHGDAQCTDDAAYMQFREQVRQPRWQQDFLALPLGQRKAIIADLRNGSRDAQREKSDAIMDVNQAAIEAMFERSGAQVMIHGHTHRPALHAVGAGQHSRMRYVLPDWDCDTDSTRGGWIGMHADGKIVCYAVDGRETHSAAG